MDRHSTTADQKAAELRRYEVAEFASKKKEGNRAYKLTIFLLRVYDKSEDKRIYTKKQEKEDNL